MRRREFITLLGAASAVWPLAAQAQQRMLPVVSMLRLREVPEAYITAFRRGLGDSGYTDGKDVTVDIRVAVVRAQLRRPR